jgi:uncharacterized protein (DUF1330 family)
MYITKTELENYLLVDIDLSFEDQVEKWIETATNYVEKYTGRQFTTTEEERYFDGSGDSNLVIDDCISIIKIENNVTENEVEDYKLYPANTTPKTSIYNPYLWYKGAQNYTIEAEWGYSESVPEDIKFATTVITAGIINGQLKEGAIQSEKIGDYNVSYKDDQKEDYKQAIRILDSYKRYTI